jgi:uncharacterized protein Yka (UPF0111/DUF47 family)
MAKLFKKDEKFFKIFGQMTVYILEAAEILGNMLRNPTADLAPLAARIKDLEHKGDELTHNVIFELTKTFRPGDVRRSAQPGHGNRGGDIQSAR